MPQIKQSATLYVEKGIDLPMSPPIVIFGKGKDGKVACQLHISATGVMITGPKGGELYGFEWEGLAEHAQELSKQS